MFDEQPDGDPHGECAAEIHRLKARITELEMGAVVAWECKHASVDHWSPCTEEAYDSLFEHPGFEVRPLFAAKPPDERNTLIEVLRQKHDALREFVDKFYVEWPYNEWPGGMAEIKASQKHHLARIAELEERFHKQGLMFAAEVEANTKDCARISELETALTNAGERVKFLEAKLEAKLEAVQDREGWRLYPYEPTESMVNAALSAKELGFDIAAQIIAAHEAAPVPPDHSEKRGMVDAPEKWGDAVRYLTDDRDTPDRHELVIMPGGNGDWYVGVWPEGHHYGPSVRLATSGGASFKKPGLTVAIADAYRALLGQLLPAAPLNLLPPT